MRFELFTAFRYLRSKKDNFFISKLLAISILTVSFSIMVPIIVLSVINGFHTTIQEKIIGNSFQLRIRHRYDNFESYKEVLKQIKANPDVKYAIHFFERQGLIKIKNGTSIFSVVVKAFRNEDIYKHDLQGKLQLDESGKPIPKNKLFAQNFKILAKKDILYLPYRETEDDKDSSDDIDIQDFQKVPDKNKEIPFQINKVNGIIIGDALSKYIHVLKGSNIKLLIPTGEIQWDIDPENVKTLKVANIYSAEYAKFDKTLIFIHYNAIKEIFKFKDIPTDLGIILKEGASAKSFTTEIEKKYPDLIVTNTLEEGLFKDFAQEKSLMLVLLLFLVLSAFITIYIAVHVVVMDKRKEIGLLKTIGSKRKAIQLIFVTEGALISITGVILGTLSGILITMSLDGIVSNFEDIVNGIRHFLCQSKVGGILNINCYEDWHVMDRGVFYLTTFPYKINYSDISILCVGAIFVSLIAAYLPSKKASEQKVVDSLRI